jgi:diketogulonate reductase-like aldo/keto reductase
MNIQTRVKLNNGIEIPILGLGTWQMRGKQAEESIKYALDIGYRHFDTAAVYENEESVGKAIRSSTIPRDQIFITTKISNDEQGYKHTVTAFENSLKKLNLSYIDLYLIHWPLPNLRNETWKAMEVILKYGKCRAIGVSNFIVKHLKQLMNHSLTIPVINQVEFSPYLNQKELLEFCHTHRIQLEAYSPLTRGKRLEDSRLVFISRKYNKSVAQILIRWALQSGIVVIPKASTEDHLKENASVFNFKISSEDMETLNSLNENFRVCWNPYELG